ncbi:hypothetical protein E3N88_15225 [Mikania micrantha]|uniref:Uncharacterized protein n=1 Tax=Mikania micrantha TaxID=192012 RepID=A0A5N6NXZ7_9ASTR|nr:hypothetical protein E3N88_15225 [Mikania micrantha]
MEVDSSRYAMAPRREASRYAEKTGSRDSRILSRYAANNFDRPPREFLEANNKQEDLHQPLVASVQIKSLHQGASKVSQHCVTGDCDPDNLLMLAPQEGTGFLGYLKGLPPSIEDMVTSSKPDTIQSAIRLAHHLIDHTVRHGTLGT